MHKSLLDTITVAGDTDIQTKLKVNCKSGDEGVSDGDIGFTGNMRQNLNSCKFQNNGTIYCNAGFVTNPAGDPCNTDDVNVQQIKFQLGSDNVIMNMYLLLNVARRLVI